jgi:hypothetical protein
MYRNFAETFNEPELNQLVKEGAIVGYEYEGVEDYERLRITLPPEPNGSSYTISIESGAGCDGSSRLSVHVY